MSLASNVPDAIAEKRDASSELDEWARAATRLVRAQMALAGVTYKELAALMVASGFQESERKLISKVTRGSFTVAFFLQVMTSLGKSDVSFAGVVPTQASADGLPVATAQGAVSTATSAKQSQVGLTAKPLVGTRPVAVKGAERSKSPAERRRAAVHTPDASTEAIERKQKKLVSEDKIAAVMAKHREIMFGASKKKTS